MLYLPKVTSADFFALLSVLWMLFFIRQCLAGVAVVENVSPGAASWPGNPILSTMSNPSGQATVGESFNAVGGCTNYAETFTIGAANYTLQTISLYAGGGTGTGAGTNLILRLFDLGTQSAPNPSPYTPGKDLFNDGNGLSVSYAPQTAGVLQFNFTGADQVTLSNGHLYAFEINGALNSSPLAWWRAISDTYGGGAAYRNRGWINANSARDFALAVYGTAANNTNSTAEVFWGPAGSLFHGFNTTESGVNLNGANPDAGLVFAGGVLYGTTLNGGPQGAGLGFSLALDGTNFGVFHSFTNAPDAGFPQGELLSAGDAIFGTTVGGGSNGVGTVFSAKTNGSIFVLKSFAPVSADNATNLGGASPTGPLVLAEGRLYGTASAGGAGANGGIFSLATNGSAYSNLHDFGPLDSNTGTNTDGALPLGGMVLSGGVLYGTASAGGSGGAGVVFRINTNGSGFAILHHFQPLDSQTATNTDGAFPCNAPTLSGGTLFGATLAGGAAGRGVIYSLGTNGLGFTLLHEFSATDPMTGTNADGASPCSALTLYGNTLYGTAAAGGAGGSGAVFLLTTNGGQFQTIYSFTPLDSSTGTNADGALPVAGVVPLGTSLFGTTFAGGPGGAGGIFRVTIPYPPAIITDAVRSSDQRVTLYFMGGPNSTNIIQTATNLSPVSWQDVSTNVADGTGAWQFSEASTNFSQFYRSYAP